jgi:short-subunit dehydrogenase
VITGASSGIGASAANELASKGFNVMLIARREERMVKQCEQLSKAFSVNAAYFTFDFANAFTDRQLLMNEVMKVTGGNVAILIHMAGNSDLAVHFTDKPLERNMEIMKLQTEGTLVIVQEFCQLMCRRAKRSAIMTAGAITAYAAQPGFVLASANKAWIRYFSIAAAFEFQEKIDIMCAHPINVVSEIVKSSSWRSISSKQFIQTSLGQLGKHVETNGSAKHDFLVWARVALMPNWLYQTLAYKNVFWFSKILQRPIDARPLSEKFPVTIG